MANSISYLYLLFISLAIIIGSVCSTDQYYPHQIPMFIFGDSIVDTGNNNYINTIPIAQANYWPYGLNFFKYPTGRWSDGRVVPDFFAGYANLRLVLPYLHPGNKHYIDGANFASGGAGALDEINSGLVISLNSQLRNFKKVERIMRKQLGDSKAKALLSKGVYLFSIGTNDYRTFAIDSKLFNSYSLQQYVDFVIGNLTTVIKEVHKKGGRKFVTLNIWSPKHVPAVQEAAASRGEAARVKELNELVELHNEQLYTALQKLDTKLKGFRYSYGDSYKVFNEIGSNPAKYGLKEVNVGCCGSGRFRGIQSCGGKGDVKEYELCENSGQHLFYDADHGTDRGYQILAEMIWNGYSNSSRPVNVKSLFH